MRNDVKNEQNIRHRIRKAQRLLSMILACCLGYLALYRWDSHRQAEDAARLREIAGVSAEQAADSPASFYDSAADREAVPSRAGEKSRGNASPSDKTSAGSSTESAPEAAADASLEYTLPGYETLLQINPQIKGWIAIPDTQISFPLLQGEDNDYYLKHDIYGQKNRHGAIFVDCDADLYGGEGNLIIYGHHMRDGSMFGGLKAYREESYYREHPSFFLYIDSRNL